MLRRIVLSFMILFLSFNAVAVKRLLVWIPDDEVYRRVFSPVFAIYEKKNNVKINIETFALRELKTNAINEVMKGSGPDLLFGINDWIGMLKDTKTIIELNDLIDSPKFKNTITDNAYIASSVNDRIFLAPVSMSGLVLLYNTDIVSAPPATFKEMVDIAVKKTDPAKGIYGLGSDYTSSYYTVPFILGFGGKILNDDRTIGLGSRETINAFRAIHDIVYKQKCSAPLVGRETLLEIFIEGKVAMLICGTWDLKNIIDSGKADKFKVAMFPEVSSTGLKIRPLVEFKGLMVTASSKNKKDAAKLAEYMCMPEAQRYFAKSSLQIPTLRKYVPDVEDETMAYYEAFQKQLDIAYPMPKDLELEYYWAATSSTIKKILKVDTFEESIIVEMANKYNDLLARKKKKK